MFLMQFHNWQYIDTKHTSVCTHHVLVQKQHASDHGVDCHENGKFDRAAMRQLPARDGVSFAEQEK